MNPNDYKTLSAKVSVKQDEERVLTFVISDDSIDRDEEVLEPQGAKLDNYRDNPVVFEGHPTILDILAGDPNNPRRSIGKGLDVRQVNNTLELDVQFAPEDISPQAFTLYKLYRDGYQKAVSVGFRRLREEEKNGVNHVVEWELVENSLVPIGANSKALRKAYEDGKLTADDITKSLASLDENQKNYKKVLTELKNVYTKSSNMANEDNSNNKNESADVDVREDIKALGEEIKTAIGELTKSIGEIGEAVKALGETKSEDSNTDSDTNNSNDDDPELEGDDASKAWQDAFDKALKEGK